MIAGALVQIIAKIPFILNPYSIVNVYINAIGVGIGATITFIMFNTNRNNISDLIEAENGRRLDTMISTGDGLAAKLAQALAAQLMTFSLAKAAEAEPESSRDPYDQCAARLGAGSGSGADAGSDPLYPD